VLSISDRTADYAEEVQTRLEAEGLRTTVDTRSEKIGYKVREAELLKVPYMVVLGTREAEESTISVRARSGEDLGGMTLEAFLDLIRKERFPDMDSDLS
ncbi:MAG: His/Gly/Thr/Pro-type tRNA ligase C-terminal domain-containing protein, partial [Bacteroidetes bacterium]|nr:His/Gly/Thr/Pro-type tRNA ligase C-terminal domain-containing protein [Bacteroidota bacterium]